MAIINYEIRDDVLFLKPVGRIDSVNASEAEAETFAIISSNKHKEIVIDADQLEYVSSAGLRVILKIRKEDSTLKIINVSNDIYEIFEMTGFTEMIPVERGLRKISIEGCEVIGRGANGEVYRLDPDTIIKVYLCPDSYADVVRERELSRKAFVLGIPTAIPYDVVRVNDTYGSIFEAINSLSFSQVLARYPERIEEVVKKYTDLAHTIHSTIVPEPGILPDKKKEVVKKIEMLDGHLPEDIYAKIHKLVLDIPDSNHIIHGDYHIKNVMLQNDEPLLIDMDTLSIGNPIFEFMGVYNAYYGYLQLEENLDKPFLGIPLELSQKFYHMVWPSYFPDPQEAHEAEQKARLLGCSCLLSKLYRTPEKYSPETVKKAKKFYEDNIYELINEVNSLAI